MAGGKGDLGERTLDPLTVPVDGRLADGSPRPSDLGLTKVLPNADVVDLAAYKAKGKTAGQAPNSDGAPGEIRTRAPASGGRCSIP